MRITESIPSKLEIIPEHVSLIMERLKRFLIDEKDAFDVKLALQEAVVNAAKHGHQCADELKICVDITVDQGRLTIEVTDEGSGYDHTKIPNPSSSKNISKPGGRGVFLIKHAMNKVEFLNKGRTIRMVKILKKKKENKSANSN